MRDVTPPSATSRRPQAGFTLIEVLVASVVMTIGVVGVLAAFPQALRSTKQSGRISVLNHLAAEHLEQLRSLDYTHSDLTLGTHPNQSTHSRGEKYYAVSGFPEDYSVRWIVAAGPTDQSGTPEPDMKTVTIEAAFRIRYKLDGTKVDDPNGLEVTLQTFVTE